MATKIQQILDSSPNKSVLFCSWLSGQGLDAHGSEELVCRFSASSPPEAASLLIPYGRHWSTSHSRYAKMGVIKYWKSKNQLLNTDVKVMRNIPIVSYAITPQVWALDCEHPDGNSEMNNFVTYEMFRGEQI